MACTLIVHDAPGDLLEESYPGVDRFLILSEEKRVPGEGKVQVASIVPSPAHVHLSAAVHLVQTPFVAWLPPGKGHWPGDVVGAAKGRLDAVPVAVSAVTLDGTPVACSPHCTIWPTAVAKEHREAIFSSNESCHRVFLACGGVLVSTDVPVVVEQ